MFLPVIKRFILDYYLTACVLATVIVLVWRFWKYMKLYADFPTYPFSYMVAFSSFTKIPKHLPFPAFLFQKLVHIAHQFKKEERFLIWMPKPHLFIFGGDAVKIFSNEKVSVDKPDIYEMLKDAFGNGLLTSNGNTWRMHRKLLNPVFHVGMLKKKISIFNENAEVLVKKLEEKATKETSIDVLELLKPCAFGALCDYLLGLNMNISENEEMIKRYIHEVTVGSQMMVTRFGKPWLNFKFIMKFLPFGREYAKLKDSLRNFTQKTLSEMRKKMILQDAGRAVENDSWMSDEETRKSFPHIMLEHHLKDNVFTMEDIQDQVATFMLGGFDTVAYGALWTLFLLGHHPDVQDQAYNEVNALIEGNIKYEDLHKLKYLECVIKESMRLYPPIPLYARKLHKDIQCEKYIVPQGTSVVFFPYMLHRNPDVYPDPEKFDPDRFQEGNSPIHPGYYIPFGKGVRNCIGKGFAMTEMKVIFAHILRKFKITSLENREDVDLTWNIVLAPVKPLLFRFTPRKLQATTVM